MNIQKTFAMASEKFRAHGFDPRDLLPIIPPGAKVWSGSNIADKHIGKVPGRYRRDTDDWVGLVGSWPVMGLEPIIQQRAANWPTGNVGLRAAAYPAIDIDVEDAKLVAIIEFIIDMRLGFAPLRFRAGTSRELMVYRLKGDEPARKMRLQFKKDGREHAIEALGMGQQYLIAGEHPSGGSYEWRKGSDLAQTGANGLTLVSPQDLRDVLEQLQDELVREGCEIVTRTEQHGGVGVGALVSELDPVIPVDIALEALRAVPNDQQHLPDRNDLVGVVAAFKAAVGRVAEEYRYEVERWACQHGWCDEAYFNSVWGSVTHVRVSPDYLIQRARKVGWHGDVTLDFEAQSEDDHQIIAAAEAVEQDHVAATAAKLVYLPEQGTFIVLGTGERLKGALINAHVIGLELAPSGLSGQKAAFSILRNSGLVRDVVGETYYPGKPRVTSMEFNGREGLWFNRWQPNPLAAGEATDEDVSLWLKHMEWLFPKYEERQCIIQFLAHVMQRPGHKVRWAPVIVGGQGLGKDLMLKPVNRALGRNATEVSPAIISGDFTDWVEHQFVVVQEMHRLDKVDAYEKLKASITGTGAGILTINRKHQAPYPVPNMVAFLFFTNHPDAIAIAPDDRRFYVVACAPVAPEKPEYYDAIDKWYDAGGLTKVAQWLLRVDLTGFNADRAPEWTAAKREMLETSLPEAAKAVMEALRDEFGERTVMPVNEIRKHVKNNFGMDHGVRGGLTDRVLALAMRSAGWLPGPVLRVGANTLRIWCKTEELSKSSAEFLRATLKAQTGQDFNIEKAE